MLAARSQLDGERRPVTILFTDIVGSTSIASTLDPEDWREIVAGAHQRVSDAIYRYEGTITQLLGDGVLAFFGAPIAHEDDPVRAVHAALEIQESITEYSQEIIELTTDFQVRAGINTGNVVIGDIGTDMHVEYLAFGDAVNVASRLEGVAKPGTVVVSEDTHKLISHNFETESLGNVQLKGKTESLPAFRVTAPKIQLRKLRGIEGLNSPLVGREREYEAMSQSLENLLKGKGGITYVIGEAGLGKSRLVAEIRKEAITMDLGWVEGRCLSYGGSIALSLWQDALRDLIGIKTFDPSIEEQTKLQDWLKDISPTHFTSTYPYLGHLLSIPLEVENERRIQNLDGEDLKTATYHAVETVIHCSASSNPLVLVCEDLHWTDPSSLELLESLFGLTLTLPLLIISVLRPETEHASWSMKETISERYPDSYKEISLKTLSEDESGLLVQNLLPIDELSQELHSLIMDRAEGNPFYVEEIIRSLIDSEVLMYDEPSDSWRSLEDIKELPIPDTLHGVLLARIDRLSSTSKRVLQRASVIGRIFEHKLLDRLSPSPLEDLPEQITILENREFIRTHTGTISPQYIFNHALTHEVAYESLLKKQRRNLHTQVGDALESLYADSLEEKVEILAHHFQQAQEWGKAWRYQVAAGRKAKAHFANQEALEFLQAAIDASTHLPQMEPLGLVDVHILRADVLSGINQYEEAQAELNLSTELATKISPTESRELSLAQIDHKRSLVLRNLGEYSQAIEVIKVGLDHLPKDHPSEEGALKIAMASALTRMGELVDAQKWCHGGMNALELGGDLAEMAHAYSLLGTIQRNLGDIEASLLSRQKSLDISEELDNIPLQMEAHNNLAATYYNMGKWDEAAKHYDTSRKLSEHIGNKNTAARAEINLGEVYLLRGDWEEAEEAFRHALESWERTGYTLGQAYGSSNIGAVLTRRGKPGEALEYLQRSQDLFAELGARGFLPSVYRRQASAYLAMSELDTAENLCLKSLNLTRELSMSQEEGAALRIHGVILREQGKLSQAAASLEQSVSIFEEAGVEYEKARSLFELALLWHEKGEPDRVQAALSSAAEIFISLGAKSDLQKTEELLSNISS